MVTTRTQLRSIVRLASDAQPVARLPLTANRVEALAVAQAYICVLTCRVFLITTNVLQLVIPVLLPIAPILPASSVIQFVQRVLQLERTAANLA